MNTIKPLNIILAVDLNYAIGYKNKLPWHISSELRYFKKITTDRIDKNKKNALIMGYKTWLSINKELKDRLIIILSKKEVGNNIFNNLDSALQYLYNREDIENIFVIGGKDVFNLILETSYVNMIYLNVINNVYEADTYFNINSKLQNFKLISEKQEDNITYKIYLHV